MSNEPVSSSDSAYPPKKVSVDESGLRTLQAEHSLVFEVGDSLRWLRRCRIGTRVTSEANIPIVCGACALLESVLLRCTYEVLRERRLRGGETGDILGRIERSEYYGQAVLNLGHDLFPATTHPRCGAFVKQSTEGTVKALFGLRNIAAHGGSVWTQLELPKTSVERVTQGDFLKQKYAGLFNALASLGYDFRSADGVYGLTELFKRNDIVDALSAGAFEFLRGISGALRQDCPAEAAAFHPKFLS